MNRYEKGQIYKVVDIGYNMCYIGSMCQSLSKRFYKHKEKYYQYTKGKADCNRRVNIIFDRYGIENCKIELLQDFPCQSRNELLRQEGEHIRNNDCVNKIVSGRTNEEWRKDNYEHYINQKRQNWNETKDEQNRKKREFAKNNPDIIKQRSQDNYEKFKDKLLERHLCGCGKYYTQCHKKRHEQTKKHQDWLKQQEQE